MKEIVEGPPPLVEKQEENSLPTWKKNLKLRGEKGGNRKRRENRRV